MPEFELHTTITAPALACFELSLSVDAHRASMGGSGEQAIAGVTQGQMALGDEVTWRARHFGLPFTMTSAITAHESPHRFVDEQVSGPFAQWWHEHTFTDAEGRGGGGGGQALMVDRIRFRAPLGPLGTVAEVLVLRRYLPRLIEHRNDWLRRTLEAG